MLGLSFKELPSNGCAMDVFVLMHWILDVHYLVYTQPCGILKVNFECLSVLSWVDHLPFWCLILVFCSSWTFDLLSALFVRGLYILVCYMILLVFLLVKTCIPHLLPTKFFINATIKTLHRCHYIHKIWILSSLTIFCYTCSQNDPFLRTSRRVTSFACIYIKK